MLNMEVTNYLKPLTSDSTISVDKHDISSINNNISSMFKFAHDAYEDYLITNNLDMTDLESSIFRYYMTEKVLDQFTITSNIKNCILIASFLSNLYKNSNIDNFILGSPEEKKMIIDMINLIFNNNTDVEQYMLIPKYVAIIDRIGKSGIIKFINLLEKSNTTYNIYDEMIKYSDIVLNYKFNIPQLDYIYNLRINKNKEFYTFIKNNSNYLMNDIIFFLE